MQLGLKHTERNPLEDTKRVVEQLRKNGTVDNLFSQALQQLFQSESFKSEVRQYLQERGQPPKTKEAAEHVRDMALSALTGLLAGTYSLQPQQQESAAEAAGPARMQQQPPQQQQCQQGQSLQQQQQQQQQQQPLGPGQKGPGQQQQQLPVAQRQLPVNKQQPQQQQQQQRLQQQRQIQQQQKLSIHEDVSLRLQVALIQMLETEERYLQGQFKLYYQRHMQHLQDDRTFQLPDFTAEPPQDVRETPLSPTSRYNASEFDLEQSEQQQQQAAAAPQQQYQQHVTQLGVGLQH